MTDEQRQAIRERVKVEWARVMKYRMPCDGSWAPIFTPEQRIAHEKYVQLHKLPF